MTFATYLARRVWWSAAAAISAILLAGAAAGFWYGPNRISLACIATAAAIGIALLGLRDWPSKPAGGARELGQPFDVWLITLGILLMVLLFAMAAGLRPALTFVQEHFEEFNRSFDTVLLMTPLFQLTVFALLAGGVLALLFLLVAGDQLFSRAVIALTLAHLGLLMCTFSVADVVHDVGLTLGSELPVVQQHDDVVAKSARNMAWGLAVYAIAIPVLVARNRSRPAVVPASPARAATPTGRPTEAPALEFAGSHHPFGGAFYSVRATYLAGLFGGIAHIDDLDTVKSFTARILPMRLRKSIRISSDSDQIEVLRIEAQQMVAISAPYDIFDPRSVELIGTVRHHMGGEWSIEDRDGREIGTVKRKDMSLGSATYEAYSGPHHVATFRSSNTPKAGAAVDFSRDAGHTLDRRVGIALALLVFLGDAGNG